MPKLSEFERYINYLCDVLGHQDRHAGFADYSRGLSLASERGSVPIEFRLYLPEQWAKDQRRREKAAVPKEVKFFTKHEIALEQLRAAKGAGVPVGMVVADGGYGNDTSWREELSKM